MALERARDAGPSSQGWLAAQGGHLRHHSMGEQTRTQPRVSPESQPGAQADVTALIQDLEMGACAVKSPEQNLLEPELVWQGCTDHSV